MTDVNRILQDVSTSPTIPQEDEQFPISAESPAGTQVTETEASTLPSPEYTDVEADLEEGKHRVQISN